MKKTHKRIVGVCGLVAVVATTVFAATLPGPEASAATRTSFTDTLNVRVIGEQPNIDVDKPKSGSTVVSPFQELHFTYEGVGDITIHITYTNPDGVTQTDIYGPVLHTDYTPGEYSDVLDLIGLGYGYGDYVITVEGYGADGVPGTESVSFSYYPADVNIEETPGSGEEPGGGGGGGDGDDGTEGGDYTFTFEFDDESGLGEVVGADIFINNADSGKLVKEFPVEPFPTDTYRLAFADYGLPSGTYIITIRVGYTYNGNTHYVYYRYTVTYKAGSMKVPDTGGILGNLNISKSDYLATGLIVFGIVGVAGFVCVAKRGKKTTKRRR